MTKKTNTQMGLKRRLQEATDEERAKIREGLPYEIGFGKPPVHSQFRPGRSGNSKGRPRGSRNLGKILQNELDQRVEVQEGGRRRKLPKGEIAIRQCANKAAGGDLKAFALIVELLRKTGQLEEIPAAVAPPIDQRDLHAADQLLRIFNAEAEETREATGAEA